MAEYGSGPSGRDEPERRADTAASLVLGLDLGTSALKVVALGEDDRIVGEGSAPFETFGDSAQRAEQAPADWLSAASLAMRELRGNLSGMGAGNALIEAIGVTGQLPTLVVVSEAGPVAPAITWKDGRADRWAAGRVDAATRARMYAATGMPIDGRYLAPMLQFHFGQRLAGITGILSAKDYLLGILTGRSITEPSTAAGYGIYDLTAQGFSRELSQFWELPGSLLPLLLPANSPAGALIQAGADLLGVPAGIPVSTGGADSVCAAYAMSGLDERAVSISLGSSAVIMGASATPRLDSRARYLVTPHVLPGWYGLEMDLLATGTGYRWLSNLFGWSDGQIDLAAGESPPGSRGLHFSPYLAGGEQGALWNPRLKAGIAGLGLHHSRADIARAYLEGMFYEIRRCIDVLAEVVPIEAVRVSGQIGQPGSTQMLADILNRPISLVACRSPAAVGAAMLARSMVRGSQSSHNPVRPPAAYPDPAIAHVYADLYRGYREFSATCQ
jgi:xylulokinase